MNADLLNDQWLEKLPPMCPKCGYNLTGLPEPRCPECGGEFLWTELRKNARRAYHAFQQADDANDLASAGQYTAGVGAAALLVFWLLGWGGLGRVTAVFLGLATVGLGLQVLRAARIPEWAAGLVRVRPNYNRGVVVALLGAILIGLAIVMP
jgi:hypothetical protein